MIGTCSVGHEHIRWEAGVISFSGGLLVGALLLAGLLVVILRLVGAAPSEAAGYYALLAATLLALRGPRRMLGSPWRVPASWTRFGRVAYGWLFGLSLGIGVVVATSSLGFIVLVGWALTDPGIFAVIGAFSAFAMGRQLAFLAIVVPARMQGEHPGRLVEVGSNIADSLVGVELALITALGWVLLLR